MMSNKKMKNEMNKWYRIMGPYEAKRMVRYNECPYCKENVRKAIKEGKAVVVNVYSFDAVGVVDKMPVF